ncbi:MAG: hypothetical protein RJQ10_04985 [Haliea sp.]|uniref:hypothetical protein n=1 Tax=Haliea sp. TaxID=1932666 RepID=UPI0032EE2D64
MQMHSNPWYLTSLGVIAVLLLVAVLAWLTAEPEPAPCADVDRDVGAAVLADENDQDALVNRAILMRGKCEPEE